VYAIWATTDLLAPWRVEAEVWPTDTNAEPFTVAVAGRDKLFLKAEDWTDVDSNGDGVPDWWLWYWFGNLEGLATNLDIYGATYLFDYENGLNPNVIRFSIQITNNYIQTANVTVPLKISGGVPAYQAILVDDENFADADWTPYTSSNLTVNLAGWSSGWHGVWIGLRGFADETTDAVWQWKHLNLEPPPKVVITSPPAGVVDKPFIQIQGYCQQPIAKITFDISNALGVATGFPAEIADQYYDNTVGGFTTNFIECVDVPLTNGPNLISFHVKDFAGNTATTDYSYVLDYSGKTNPPSIQISWPTNGMQLGSSTITVFGHISDPTASVNCLITDKNGKTNIIRGAIDRKGDLWCENCPVTLGTNGITLTVTDVAGNQNQKNFQVIRSPVTLTIDKIPDSDAARLWKPTIFLNGIISDPTYAVWVNGVKAVNNQNGTWYARNVPVNSGGAAKFTATAYAPNEVQPDGSLGN
jgi:hypothetical protein